MHPIASGSACDDERPNPGRLNQPPEASAAGSATGASRLWRRWRSSAMWLDSRAAVAYTSRAYGCAQSTSVGLLKRGLAA